MKKGLVVLLLLAVVTVAFADDALVLPKGVLRTYLTGAYAFASSEWDKDGEKKDFKDVEPFEAVSFINLGGAFEFGVLDWISAAVQWGPGYNIWSKFENPVVAMGVDENATVNGPFDIFAGAKIQIVGENAPVANDTIRLAFAPGVKIPLPSPDWQEQAENKAAGDSWIALTLDKHVLGVGLRGYFDYVLNKMFYVNLYSELIFYPQAKKLDEVSFAEWAAVQLGAPNVDVEYGYDLLIEAEPHYETMLSDGLRLGIGVPVTFTMTPEIKYDDTAASDTDSYLLSVGPNVSLFLMEFFVPLEFEVGYILPLAGKNNFAANQVVLQIKSYLKFF